MITQTKFVVFFLTKTTSYNARKTRTQKYASMNREQPAILSSFTVSKIQSCIISAAVQRGHSLGQVNGSQHLAPLQPMLLVLYLPVFPKLVKK